MTTCPMCHGKDGLHGLDCGFASVRPHMTHHDDCGCLTARYQARIAALEAENKALYERRLPCREAEIAQKRYENAEAEVSRAWGERNRYLKKLQECNTQLRSRFDEHIQASTGDRGHTWMDALRYVGASPTKGPSEPDCDNCPQPHDEYNEPDCDARDAAWVNEGGTK